MQPGRDRNRERQRLLTDFPPTLMFTTQRL